MYSAAAPSNLNFAPNSPLSSSSHLPVSYQSRILPSPFDRSRSSSSAHKPPLIFTNGGRALSTLTGGLRTPPGDDDAVMGTTYQPPALATYDDRRHGPSHPSVYSSQLLSEAERKRTILSEAQAALTLSSSLAGGRPSSRNSGITESTVTSNTLGANSDVCQRSLSAAPIQQVLQPPMQASAQFQTSSGRSLDSQHRQQRTEWTSTLNGGLGGSSRSKLPTTPKVGPTSSSQSATFAITEQDSAAMVMHSLEIPKCISRNGGSLSDFTAELTCLFWFESPHVYQLADNIDMIPSDVWIPRVCANAIPSPNFKSWVNRMLTTTQVTQNVVLLALLFIYRLKSLNPMVRGKPGSEFRLLTVALMLGNKFLDDNTYTNKTWSDVSCLNVKEIHVMEVEFLSNMRYSLLVSKAEWETWLVKMAKFRMYYERASAVTASPSAASPRRPFASPVPSPTAPQQTTSSFPMATGSPPGYDLHAYSPSAKQPLYAAASAGGGGHQQQPWTGPFPGVQVVSPLASKPDMKNGHGKRVLPIDDPTEPPPKRATARPLHQQQQLAPSAVPYNAPAYNPSSSSNPAHIAPSGDLRLPAPHLTLNTSVVQPPVPTAVSVHPYQTSASAVHTAQAPKTTAAQVTLPPPLAHGVRAMATVYSSANSLAPPVSTVSGPSIPLASGPIMSATTTPGLVPQLPMLTTTGPGLANAPATTLAGGGTTPTAYTAPGFGTPTKRMSPLNTMTPGGASAYAVAASSPLTDSFPHMAGVHTPISHSPSVYLQQRASPYRPIRNVHMLLNPPPSASLQEYQTHGAVLIPPTQMFYQPLGRRNDLRTGIVPEFQGDMSFGPGARSGFAMAPMAPVHTAHQQAMQQLHPLSQMRDMRGQPINPHHLQPPAQPYNP